jgi:hypothetical protein
VLSINLFKYIWNIDLASFISFYYSQFTILLIRYAICGGLLWWYCGGEGVVAILSLVWVVRVWVLVVISMGDVREEPREHTKLTCAERSAKESPVLRV